MNKTVTYSRAPDFFLAMIDCSMEVLRKQGIPDERASDISVEITRLMAKTWRGEQIHVPKRPWLDLIERDWSIYHEYVGTNRTEVCEKYKISFSRLHQIITAARISLKHQRGQLSLFPPADAQRPGF